ncbi:DUF6454 family protein [Novosphingobium sp.]|uniref:DUF6454 family protein n=1 Tax=Novosphingobium sp. TaxID=1874826 RepID=UPI001E06C769|nr:DUF6454 family protein [Novosphingobium sp.]MBX9662920.1 DUF6454 family protein [Novosphingobium sp.]
MIGKLLRGGFLAVLNLASGISLSASPGSFSPATYDGELEHGRYVGALQLQGEVFHVQGLALDPKHVWVTSVDNAGQRAFLHLFDRASGRFLRRLELTDGARYHPGGLSLSGGSLWVPVAELRPDSSAVLVEIDAETLTVRRRIAVADHIGCVAADGTKLVAGNWDSRQLYTFDLARGTRPVKVVDNPSGTHFQDMKFVDGKLVAGGNTSWLGGTLDWIDPATMRVTRSLKAGSIGPVRPFGRGGPVTGEGMAIEGREVYVLPEDGPSRVFHFRLDA